MAYTAFLKQQVLVRGSRADIVPKLRQAQPVERASDLLVFDDETGKQVDFDLRPDKPAPARGRGRPALGVEGREVTLLPRHWEWLANQRGGASATLRELVEDAIGRGRTRRQCQDAAYRFLRTMAGDLPKFEDAVRELYADNPVGYDHFAYEWPPAIRDHGRTLAWPREPAERAA